MLENGCEQVKRKLIFMIATIVLLIGTITYGEQLANIDISDINQGIVHLNYKSSKKLKVIIKNEQGSYTYNLKNTGEVETFPLQLGDGQYEIGIYENTSGIKYKNVLKKVVSIKDLEQTRVYLNTIQNINWNENSKAVKLGEDLTKGLITNEQKAKKIYLYMLTNFKYDYDKQGTMAYNYVPSIDEVLTRKSGICYDIAALYAAMLRSQGIPTKLVTGYSENAIGYHSWNEVYDETNKEWYIVDLTYDVQQKPPMINSLNLKDPIQIDKIKKDSNLYMRLKEY